MRRLYALAIGVIVVVAGAMLLLSTNPSSEPEFVNRRAIRWETATVTDDGREITVSFWGGNPTCHSVDVEVDRQSDGSAVVRVFQADIKDLPCTAEANLLTVIKPVNPPLSPTALLADGAT